MKLSKPNIFILNNRWDASASEPEMQEQVGTTLRGGGGSRDAGAGRDPDQAERGGGCSREPEMQEQVGTRLRGGGVQQRTRDAGAGRDQAERGGVQQRTRDAGAGRDQAERGGGAAENQRCRSR